MKILKIFGKLELNEKEIIKKIRNALKDFLNKNKDVDYLITYYFPTYEDMENNATLCFLLFDEDIKNIDLSDKEIYRRLQWNEDYGFFSDVVKEKTSPDYRLVKNAYTTLQVTEDASVLFYELRKAAKRECSLSKDFSWRLEQWINDAEHVTEGYGALEPVMKNDFASLLRHLSNISYCCVSEIGKTMKSEKERQWILDHEIANAADKCEVVHHQLTYLLRKYLIAREPEENMV
jgi:hypothetical protein